MSDASKHALSLGAMGVVLSGDDPVLGRRVHELLTDSGFATIHDPLPNAASLTVRSLEHPMMPPPGGIEVATHRRIRVIEHGGGRLWIGDGSSCIELDPSRGQLTAWLAPALRTRSLHEEAFLIVLYSVLTMLRFRGLFPLHAGAVACDAGGCLVIGASGSGKSSMVLQLVRAGWMFVADDSVALQGRDGSVEVTAMRRDAYFREPDPEFVAREGWRECPEFEPVKYRVPLREAYPDRWQPTMTPRAIVFPSLTRQGCTRWVRCDPPEALFSLLEHSTIGDLEPSQTASHVQVLRDLLLQTRSYRILAGTDLRNNPAGLAALMDDVISDAIGNGRPGSRA